MIICKDGCYAYIGTTAEEAFCAYMSADDDHNSLGPHELKWYSANEMEMTMTLAAKQKVAPAKTSAKK